MTPRAPLGVLGGAVDRVTVWLVTLWWSEIPFWAGRLSRALAVLLGDGVYLVVIPWMGALLPPLAFLLGLVAGGERFGATQVFTQSMLILGLAVALGTIASQLGLLFVFGFALVDFFLYANPALQGASPAVALRLRVALLISYAVLLGLAVLIPFLARLLRLTTPLPPPRWGDLRLVVELLLGALLNGGLLFLYLQAVPVLVRPLFTWRGRPPPADAVALVQQSAGVFVTIAVVAVVLSILGEYAASLNARDMVEEFASAVPPVERRTLLDRVPDIPRVAFLSVAETLLLAGLLDSPFSALILLGGLFGIHLFRTLLGAQVPLWTRMTEKIPVIVRLALALGVAFVIGTRLLPTFRLGQSFEPLVWTTLVAFAVVAVLFPAAAKGPSPMRTPKSKIVQERSPPP